MKREDVYKRQEMFYTTEAISSDPALARSIALITDGRFSGASKGPVTVSYTHLEVYKRQFLCWRAVRRWVTAQ